MTTHDEIVDESVHEATDSRKRWWIIGLMGAMILLACLTIASAWIVYDTYHSAAQRGTNLAAQVRAACADPKVDTAELGSLCDRADKVVEQAPTPPTVKGATGDTGPAGPPPTSAQVAAAIRAYCSTGLCRGRTITSAQVRQAVHAYCAERNRCKGPAGVKGVTGATGPTGATGDRGPAGQDGKDGANGTDAIPFSFTFVIDSGIPGQETTYNCVITDNSTPATCTQVEGEVIP